LPRFLEVPPSGGSLEIGNENLNPQFGFQFLEFPLRGDP